MYNAAIHTTLDLMMFGGEAQICAGLQGMKRVVDNALTLPNKTSICLATSIACVTIFNISTASIFKKFIGFSALLSINANEEGKANAIKL
ncbi:hypothetical protein RIF29_13619 [Crotalaria pallida]|uniref:Uncharacterized protein n=1 Tax=Crotalaria pallida TaxID=3830 RepID=A0AAN9IPN7_CROPI